MYNALESKDTEKQNLEKKCEDFKWKTPDTNGLNKKTDYNTKSALIINEISDSTIMVIIFWDFLIFYEILFSSQVKLSVIISNKNGIYDLPHE